MNEEPRVRTAEIEFLYSHPLKTAKGGAPSFMVVSGRTIRKGGPPARERPEPEWHELMNKAGFEITRIVPMKAAESVIEARVRR